MKKTIVLTIFLLSLVVVTNASPAWARLEPLKRVGYVFSRGIVNVVTSPLELIRTYRYERNIHKYVWPATAFPRSVTNGMVRGMSGLTDIAFMPFVVPWTEDASPIAEPMGLPEFVWQGEGT